MNFFGIGKMLTRQHEQEKASENLKTEASGFQLATDGGYIKVLKYLLFLLFAFYNARLFLTTIQGWERYVTALFALLGECTALYCFNNYTRSTGKHKIALGVFAVLLFAFAFTHASISFFRMERGDYSGAIRFYCEHVAFPTLFGLLLLAAITIPLMHWRTRIAEEQAKSQVTIASSRAKLVADAAELRDQSELERARLIHFEERIKLGNEYVDKLKGFARMKKSEREALLEIPEPLRSQIAAELGIDLADIEDEFKQTYIANKPTTWPGGQRGSRGN